MKGLALAALVVFAVAAWAGPPQAGLKIEVSVFDQSKLAVPGVRVQLKIGDAAPIMLDTGENGRAVFLELRPATYRLSVAQKGFEPVERDLDLSGGASVTVELTLVPALQRTQVEVKGEGSAVE